MISAMSTLVMTALPASAAPNVCEWHNDQDIADTSDPGCRATFLVEAGQGNILSREQLLDARDFYAAHGFNRQWLWYAPTQTVNVPDTRQQEWTSCIGGLPRIDGNACGGSVSHHLMYRPGHALQELTIEVRAFAWDKRVIVRACGNYFYPSNGSDPVPTALIEKYDDRNRNGVRDGGESGLAGWQFRVERVSSKYNDQPSELVEIVSTDASGYVTFSFNDDGPGVYTVAEIAQEGWAATTASPRTIVVEDGIGNAQVAHLKFGNAQTRADLAKVEFGLVNPPTRMDAHTPTDLTVRAEIRNNGPADVTARDTVDVQVPEDCVAEPAHDEAVRTLAAGETAIVEFRVRVTCEQPSYHPMTFTDRLFVATQGVEDPVLNNNTKAFEYVIEVYDYADIQLANTNTSCPARSDVGQSFDCTVTAVVTNAGPYGPVTTDVAFGLQPPADCQADNPDGSAAQTLSLPVGQPTTVTSQWRVTCAQRSYHDITASAKAVLRHLHVIDPVLDNASAAHTTRIEIFEPVDLVARVIDLRCDEREANTTASSCTATFTVANDGPATGVAVLVTLAIVTEADCTATPAAPQQTHLVLNSGASTNVTATWQLACTATYRHSVIVSGTIIADEPHAEDRWPANNSTTTVWGPADVKPRSLPSSVNIGKEGVVPFALLSTPTLNTLTDVNRDSLLFGGTGTEDSVISCAPSGEDVNDDGRLDLVCKAATQLTGITCSTTVALITGQLADGTRFQSEDAIKVVGCH